MRILITGCNGVIGTYLCEHLIKNGHIVHGIDNDIKYRRKNILVNGQYYKADLPNTSISSIIRFNLKPDIVIDLAADIGGIQYINKSKQQAKKNLCANLSVLQSISDKTLYIYASSGIVSTLDYSYYTQYKKCMEDIIRKFCDNYIILRLNNVVGKYEDCEIEKQHIIPVLINKIKSSNSIQLFGNGEERRCFTHGKDVAKAFEFVINNQQDYQNKILNIINKKNKITIEKLALMINEHIRPNEKLNINYKENTYMNAIYKYFPKSDLPIDYEVSLEDIIKEAVNYYG
jgi:UDP-glucose 4-epimerase